MSHESLVSELRELADRWEFGPETGQALAIGKQHALLLRGLLTNSTTDLTEPEYRLVGIGEKLLPSDQRWHAGGACGGFWWALGDEALGVVTNCEPIRRRFALPPVAATGAQEAVAYKMKYPRSMPTIALINAPEFVSTRELAEHYSRQCEAKYGEAASYSALYAAPSSSSTPHGD